MTTDQQLFCDSLVDDLADALDFDEDTVGHAQIKEIVERRIENHDIEMRAEWKFEMKRGLVGYVDRL
ncbi:MAG: hypothetical protein WC477_06200 [Patescibacteria group bacterium]